MVVLIINRTKQLLLFQNTNQGLDAYHMLVSMDAIYLP